MANNIDKALSARANKILDKQMNYRRFGILTRRQFCEKMIEIGAIPKIEQYTEVKRNRAKPDMTNWDRMVEHKSFIEKTITGYHLYYPDDPDTYVAVTKTEFDYYISLLTAKEDKADQDYWDSLSKEDQTMINGLFRGK
jgi:hypothetical protein